QIGSIPVLIKRRFHLRHSRSFDVVAVFQNNRGDFNSKGAHRSFESVRCVRVRSFLRVPHHEHEGNQHYGLQGFHIAFTWLCFRSSKFAGSTCEFSSPENYTERETNIISTQLGERQCIRLIQEDRIVVDLENAHSYTLTHAHVDSAA